jgi:hypothetical protein
VSASFLQSFDFVIAAFTPPVRPLLTRAAAQESLLGAPSGTPPHTRVGGFQTLRAVAMVNGAAASAAGWRAQRWAAKFFVIGTPTTHTTIIL